MRCTSMCVCVCVLCSMCRFVCVWWCVCGIFGCRFVSQIHRFYVRPDFSRIWSNKKKNVHFIENECHDSLQFTEKLNWYSLLTHTHNTIYNTHTFNLQYIHTHTHTLTHSLKTPYVPFHWRESIPSNFSPHHLFFR